MTAALLMVGGLALLTVAADRFVLGAARLSTALRVSPVIVGVVILGFGTTAPEMVVSIMASLEGSQDIAFGNLVGSNTANILLVLGTTAMISPIKVSVVTLRREIPLMLAGVTLLAVVTFDRQATVGAGVILLVAGLAASVVLIRSALGDRSGAVTLGAGIEEYEHIDTPRPLPSLLQVVLGLAGTIAGARMVVTGASSLATALGLSEAVIGLTVVAIGTSLPELTTAVAAARRKQVDLVVGNVLGANLFNSLPIAGIAAVIGGRQLDAAFPLALALMVGSCVLASVFLLTGRRLCRREGAVLLVLFVGVLWSTAP